MNIIGGFIDDLNNLKFDRNIFNKFSIDDFVLYYIYDRSFKKNCFKKENIHIISIGNIYENKSQKNNGKYIYDIYINKGVEAIFEVDGEFLTFIYDSYKKNITIIADREGVYPIFYDNRNSIFSTNIDIMLHDFKENDIDESSIYDYLNYATLIGNKTFSKNVNSLNGGSSLEIHQNFHNIKEYYKFVYSNPQYNKVQLMDDLANSLLNSLNKRIDRNIEEVCIFSSGGLDSRLLIAGMNKITDKKVDCITFGQKNSDELNISRQVCEVNGNKYNEVLLEPEDFIRNSFEYIRLTGGMDMFPQSYILNAISSLSDRKTLFMTGFVLDALIGETFLNEEAIKSNEKFSKFSINNKKLLKMNVFSEKEFRYLCKSYDSVFKNKSNNFYYDSLKYDDYRVEDVIQCFGINNRAKKAVILRESIPGRKLDVYYPTLDKDFLNVVSQIPAEYRLNHIFYREFFMKFAPEYCKIVYNNTTLPITAPINYWKKGAKIEFEKEKLNEQIMKEQFNIYGNYYKHFYSDFTGYIVKELEKPK